MVNGYQLPARLDIRAYFQDRGEDLDALMRDILVASTFAVRGRLKTEKRKFKQNFQDILVSDMAHALLTNAYNLLKQGKRGNDLRKLLFSPTNLSLRYLDARRKSARMLRWEKKSAPALTETELADREGSNSRKLPDRKKPRVFMMDSLPAEPRLQHFQQNVAIRWDELQTILTPRELRALELRMMRFTNREATRELQTSESRVSQLVSKARRKIILHYFPSTFTGRLPRIHRHRKTRPR